MKIERDFSGSVSVHVSLEVAMAVFLTPLPFAPASALRFFGGRESAGFTIFRESILMEEEEDEDEEPGIPKLSCVPEGVSRPRVFAAFFALSSLSNFLK